MMQRYPGKAAGPVREPAAAAAAAAPAAKACMAQQNVPVALHACRCQFLFQHTTLKASQVCEVNCGEHEVAWEAWAVLLQPIAS